jgi:hypothetical protein
MNIELPIQLMREAAATADPGEEVMTTVFIEARPKDRPEGSPIETLSSRRKAIAS